MPRLPRATELSYLVKFLLAAGGDHLRLIISSNNDTHVLQSAGQDVGDTIMMLVVTAHT